MQLDTETSWMEDICYQTYECFYTTAQDKMNLCRGRLKKLAVLVSGGTDQGTQRDKMFTVVHNNPTLVSYSFLQSGNLVNSEYCRICIAYNAYCPIIFIYWNQWWVIWPDYSKPLQYSHVWNNVIDVIKRNEKSILDLVVQLGEGE